MLRELGQRLGRSCLIQIAAVVFIVPLGFCLIMVPLWFVLGTDASIFFLIVPMLMFFVIAFGVPLAYMGTVVIRRKRKLDAALTPLGLLTSGIPIASATYHGSVDGRQARFDLQRGPLLRLAVATPLQTRFAVRAGDLPNLPSFFPTGKFETFEAHGLSGSALDSTWMRDIIAREEVQAIITRLTRDDELDRRKQVVLMPGGLFLQLYGNNKWFGLGLGEGEPRQWADDLRALAAILEDAPPPTVTAEANAIERKLMLPK